MRDSINDYFGAQGTPSLDSPPLWLYGFPDRGANTTDSPMGWIQWGSHDEDATVIRSCDHFYTTVPVRQPGVIVPGLSDWSESIGVQPIAGVVNSFRWASDPNVAIPLPLLGLNSWGWPKAREYEFKSLTLPSRQERELYLAA